MSNLEPIENPASVRTRTVWFSRPGFWFWTLIALGAAIRIYFVVFTQGTYDAGLWQLNVMGVTQVGLLDHYRLDPNANHPPFILQLESFVWRFSELVGIPFRTLLRAQFICFDAGTTLLLLKLLRRHRWRYALTAAYWINPLSIILSAYQGNTDSAIAFFLLLTAWLLSRRKTVAGGVAMGISFWIKLPGILAIPAFVLYLRGWRRRLIFLSVAAVVVLIGYLPALVQDAGVIASNVFGYHGRMLQTQGGVAAWGPRVILFSVIAGPEKWPEQLHAPVLFFLQHNWQIGLLLAVILIVLRRSRRSVSGLCGTIAMAYVTLCGLTDYWAFQYFAWTLPFWFFLRPWFFVSATVLLTAYIYSLYWTLCGNPWLLGTWDFAAHLDWPTSVLIFRNLAVIFFAGCACFFLISAIVHHIASGRSVTASESQTGHS